MSTQRKTRNREYLLTTFYGGQERGKCLQVTPEKNGYMQLTLDDATNMVYDLLDFINDGLAELEN